MSHKENPLLDPVRPLVPTPDGDASSILMPTPTRPFNAEEYREVKPPLPKPSLPKPPV